MDLLNKPFSSLRCLTLGSSRESLVLSRGEGNFPFTPTRSRSLEFQVWNSYIYLSDFIRVLPKLFGKNSDLFSFYDHALASLAQVRLFIFELVHTLQRGKLMIGGIIL